METALPNELIAVDVGNSRVKLGLFRAPGDCLGSAQSGVLPIASPPLPEPETSLSETIDRLEAETLGDWLTVVAGAGPEPLRVSVGSVCPPADARLEEAARKWAAELGRPVDFTRLKSESMPIELRVDSPSLVGVDRVAAAVAACRLRRDATPAIVVDIGTAITVDLISADGAFEGGAILPGPGLAARSLAEATEGLPPVRFDELEASPPAVGRATEPAMRSGLFWGAVGAIREIIARQRDGLTVAPQVFLTGGAAPSVARLIGGPDYTVRHVPHLTLAGVALSAGGGAP